MNYTSTMNVKDFYWVAGFLEGEGTFVCSQVNKNCNGYSFRARICVGQKERESLDRLKALVGGNIYFSPAKSRTNPIYFWQIGGAKAVGLMMMFWSALSRHRRKQVEDAISKWKQARNDRGPRKRT